MTPIEIISLEEVPREDEISEQHPPRRPEVLVVDDETLVADTLTAILNHAGFSTRTAYDGPTALQMAGSFAPELLITDVAMPDMNGVELATEMLRRQPECKILLFSGHATSASIVDTYASGYDFRLLAKPVHPTEMIRHISRMLSIPNRAPTVRRAEVVSIRRRA
jgi:DNA-binding NtrC family response regulator